MDRRAVLKCVSGLIAAGCGAIVGIPGLRYVIETVRRREESQVARQRLIRLKDLPVGRPTQVAFTGRRRDAWTVYEKENIGRVWLVRQSPTSQGSTASQSETTGLSTADKVPGAAGKIQVKAFTAVCPHLGCGIKVDGSGRQFICPCHKAAWDVSGCKVSDAELGHKNPSPRDLDLLECSVVVDEQTGESWVEVKYEKFQHGSTEKVPQA